MRLTSDQMPVCQMRGGARTGPAAGVVGGTGHWGTSESHHPPVLFGRLAVALMHHPEHLRGPRWASVWFTWAVANRRRATQSPPPHLRKARDGAQGQQEHQAEHHCAGLTSREVGRKVGREGRE